MSNAPLSSEEEEDSDRYGDESTDEQRKKRRLEEGMELLRQPRRRTGFTVYKPYETLVITPDIELPEKEKSVVGGNIFEDTDEESKSSQLLVPFKFPGAIAIAASVDWMEVDVMIREWLDLFMTKHKLRLEDMDQPGATEATIHSLFKDRLTLQQIGKSSDMEATKKIMDECIADYHGLFKELMWHTCTAYDRFLHVCEEGAGNPFFILARDLQVCYRSLYTVVNFAYSYLGRLAERDMRLPIMLFYCPLSSELRSDLLIDTDNELLNAKIDLLRVAQREKLCRVGEDLFEPIYRNGHFTYAYRLRCSVQKWVIKNLGLYGDSNKSYETFEGTKGNANDIIAYFAKRGGLPDLKYTRYMMSFRNGVYFVAQNKLVLLQNMDESLLPAKDMYSCNFFDMDFPEVPEYRLDVELPFPEPLNPDGPSNRCTAYDIPTPNLDKILHDQHWLYEVCVSLYVMLGRCLYDQAYLDNWQKALFFSGRKETGKSTFCNLISMFYPKHLVGAFASKGEETFGMQSFLRKYVIVQPEAREKWNLDSADFLKMVAGDLVSVSRKNLTAVDVKWRSPLAIAGNNALPWADEYGAVARRLLIFNFTRGIVRDDNFEKKLYGEIAHIIWKCNTFYLATIYGFRNTVVPWPAYFEESRRLYMKETSPVFAFITGSELPRVREFYVPFSEILRVFKLSHKGARSLNSSAWRVALEEEGLTMTDGVEPRNYPRGTDTIITDLYVDGCDILERCPPNILRLPVVRK